MENNMKMRIKKILQTEKNERRNETKKFDIINSKNKQSYPYSTYRYITYVLTGSPPSGWEQFGWDSENGGQRSPTHKEECRTK